MPRTEEQYKEMRENKKAIIMEAALELFAMHGFHDTSISRIAKKAKVSKGLMYNYFDSKESLLEALVNHGVEEMMDAFGEYKEGIKTREEFIEANRRTFEMMEANPEHWKLYFQLLLQPNVMSAFAEGFKEMASPMIAVYSDFFKRMGSDNPLVDAFFFGAIMDGIGLAYLINPVEAPFEQLKQKAFDMINIYLDIQQEAINEVEQPKNKNDENA